MKAQLVDFSLSGTYPHQCLNQTMPHYNPYFKYIFFYLGFLSVTDGSRDNEILSCSLHRRYLIAAHAITRLLLDEIYVSQGINF